LPPLESICFRKPETGVGPSYLLDKALRALETDSCLLMFIGFIEFDGFVGFIGFKPPSYSREQTLHAQRTLYCQQQYPWSNMKDIKYSMAMDYFLTICAMIIKNLIQLFNLFDFFSTAHFSSYIQT
jgi:hypothetical protein